MQIQQYWLFVPACFAINMALGPNNLLAVSNGARCGVSAAVLAASGRLVAFAGMIALTALGLDVLLMAPLAVFLALKFIGAGYLVWLGINLMRARPARFASSIGEQREYLTVDRFVHLSRQEFWVAACNPKALLVFTAFFPRFVERSAYVESFVILGATFLVLEVIAIAIYAAIGSRVYSMPSNTTRLTHFNRISGAVMVIFGLLLAWAGQG